MKNIGSRLVYIVAVLFTAVLVTGCNNPRGRVINNHFYTYPPTAQAAGPNAPTCNGCKQQTPLAYSKRFIKDI